MSLALGFLLASISCDTTLYLYACKKFNFSPKYNVGDKVCTDHD